jgi:hypothetical protein
MGEKTGFAAVDDGGMEIPAIFSQNLFHSLNLSFYAIQF